MTHVESIDPELLWEARLAAFREDWDEMERLIGLEFRLRVVEEYLQDQKVGRYRALLYSGIYTSYHLVHGSLDALKPIWRMTVQAIREHAPDFEGFLRDYFEGSVGKYHEMYQLPLDRAEYGYG